MVVGGWAAVSIGEREGGGCCVFVAKLFYIVVVGFGFFGSSVGLSQLWSVGWIFGGR